ncbi:LysR family transcriptional regulator [Pseudomaricurvus alkylphenolicus]|jgi:DNA-binding transcriptional LysR family regulator|uniref:LysR family transcriptional regulator n=1 Tax=Pseudomaricurvus alkylphenolicus TaxID=1306991 RepID=UPI00141EE22E|nr:LysR family transcriptional regulator [Pseudomaricurvus alkylphenolicus]NIB39314.1 LysR family transcriptional regulator [Pseudomaricurvus alkylphenolicus]
MDIKNLDRIDLNLLVALQVMLEEQSVSRAAERLYLTQSAMSKTLGRLRDLFDDRLFTRTSAGMVPTPRALELSEKLPRLLCGVQDLVSSKEFEPETHSAEFQLVIPDFVGFWAIPDLMKRLASQAPGLRLKTFSRADNQLDQLAEGNLDLMIEVERQHYPTDYKIMTVGFAPPVMLARKGHPLEGKTLTWEMIARYPQVRVYIPDLGETQFVTQGDSQFVRYESQVQPHLQTGHLFTALQVIKSTDYLLPGPPIFIEESDLSNNVIALPLPDDEVVMLKYVMVWHERTQHSRAHQFLRARMTDTVDYYRQQRGMDSLDQMRRNRNLPY